jgi:hypothetical protein
MDSHTAEVKEPEKITYNFQDQPSQSFFDK